MADVDGTLSQEVCVKILERVATSKSFETNIFMASETIKGYARQILELAVIAAPESAEKIRSVVIE